MTRSILVGIVLLAGFVRYADAQSTAKATQVVTFSVRTTHPVLIAGATQSELPADVKITATLAGRSGNSGSEAIEVRPAAQAAENVYVAPAEGGAQARTLIYTVTQ